VLPNFLVVPELQSYIELYSEAKGIAIEDFAFNNMLLNPAMTSVEGTNPGFSLFNYDNEKETIHSLELNYLILRKTYNMTTIPNIQDSGKLFQKVNFLDDYGLRKVDTKSLLRLTERLKEGGIDLIIKYITDKAGYDSTDTLEQDLVLELYTEDGLIGDNYEGVRYLCIMSEGLTNDEVEAC